MPKTMTTREFIYKSTQLHGDKYDYSATKYVKMRAPVIITCPTHGDFLQLPVNHLRTDGCSKCGHINKHVKRKSKIAIEVSPKITDEQSIAKKCQLEILEAEINRMASIDIAPLLHNFHFVQSIRSLMDGTISFTDTVYDKTFSDILAGFTSDNFSTLSDKLKFTDDFILRYKHMFDWKYISGTQRFNIATIIKCRDYIDFRTYITIHKDFGYWLLNQVIDLNHDIVTLKNYTSLGDYINHCKFTSDFVQGIIDTSDIITCKPSDNNVQGLLTNPNLQSSFNILKPFIDKFSCNDVLGAESVNYGLINAPEEYIIDKLSKNNISDCLGRLLKYRVFTDEFLNFLVTDKYNDRSSAALYESISTYQLPSESFIIEHKSKLNISKVIVRRTSHNMKFTTSFYEVMQDVLVGKSIDALRLYAFNNEVPVVVRALLNAQTHHPTIIPSPYLKGETRTTIFTESEVTISNYSINDEY